MKPVTKKKEISAPCGGKKGAHGGRARGGGGSGPCSQRAAEPQGGRRGSRCGDGSCLPPGACPHRHKGRKITQGMEFHTGLRLPELGHELQFSPDSIPYRVKSFWSHM